MEIVLRSRGRKRHEEWVDVPPNVGPVWYVAVAPALDFASVTDTTPLEPLPIERHEFVYHGKRKFFQMDNVIYLQQSWRLYEER